MHELSIAQVILDRATQASAENGGARVTAIGLRIGAISGVDAEALRFGLEVLTKDSALAGVAVNVETCQRKQRCNACGTEFEPDGFRFVCPSCKSPDSACIAGQELDVMYFELEDAACA